jgi:hypothetical protein
MTDKKIETVAAPAILPIQTKHLAAPAILPIQTKHLAAPAILPIQTKHLAARFKMKATALRRILRNMPAYADGVHTNYRWAEKDPRIADIELAIKKLVEDKATRAKAAKAALDARVLASTKQSAVDAKLPA